MLRNVDPPELIVITSASVAEDRGAARLVAEAADAGCLATYLIHSESREEDIVYAGARSSSLGLAVHDLRGDSLPPPPHPAVLSTLRRSIEVQPEGFGGSGGFGQRAADPPRAPLAPYCVALVADRACALAARAAGMRSVAVHPAWEKQEGLEAACDVVFPTLGEGEDDEHVYCEDLFTPGSFWLNPASPRDEEGNSVDPDTGEPPENGGCGLEEAIGVGDNGGAWQDGNDGSALAEERGGVVKGADSIAREINDGDMDDEALQRILDDL